MTSYEQTPVLDIRKCPFNTFILLELDSNRMRPGQNAENVRPAGSLEGEDHAQVSAGQET